MPSYNIVFKIEAEDEKEGMDAVASLGNYLRKEGYRILNGCLNWSEEDTKK